MEEFQIFSESKHPELSGKGMWLYQRKRPGKRLLTGNDQGTERRISYSGLLGSVQTILNTMRSMVLPRQNHTIYQIA